MGDSNRGSVSRWIKTFLLSKRHSDNWLYKFFTATRLFTIGALAMATLFLGGAEARAQYPAPAIPENAAKSVSPHVWVIMTFPNIAIVVGNKATLVVDTGLGAHNGSVVAHEAKRLSKGQRLYLTTTHFHPEHAGGDQGFPLDTLLIRNAAQQKEVEEIGAEWFDRFRGMARFQPFLEEGHKFRIPDVVFDRDANVDLGEVTVRLFWLGAAHTEGDELIWIEEDGTLIPGDVVQNKLAPHMTGADSSAKSWIAILDQLAPLKPRLIVPDHGELGDGSLVAQQRIFLIDLETRTLALKREGKSPDDTAKMVADEMKQKYPDWGNMNYLPDSVKKIYAEE
jgi:glyoxylase-like metal-dependent hydrolase (beta-lactamase superfamily II)